MEYDTYSLEDDARTASAAHDMLPADPSSTPGLIETRVDETDAVVRVALAVDGEGRAGAPKRQAVAERRAAELRRVADAAAPGAPPPDGAYVLSARDGL